MRLSRALVAALLVLLGLTGPTAVSAQVGSAQDASVLALRDGTTLRLHADPFGFEVVGADGGVQVASVAGVEGPPVRVPGVDGPQPLEPGGALGGFPALGFVVGVAPSASYPLPLFTGNRLFGSETGVLVSLVEVVGSTPMADGVDLQVRTDAPSLGPATLRVRVLYGGGVRLELEPPSGVTPASSVLASTGSVFPGDETTDWAQGSGLPSVVPTMLNLAVGGFPTFTTDVGGYFDFVAPRTTPELLVRWGQLAAFTPVMRVHDSTQNQSLYPTDLTGDELDAYRRYAKAKVRLVPLVDRLNRDAARDGSIGPVRPLVLDDPSPEARSVGDQWLLGRDLLVAPVLQEGATARSVYLPQGADWQPLRVADDGSLVDDGAVLAGGQRVELAVDLADIPLFERRAQPASGSGPGGPGAAAAEDAAGRAGRTLPTTGGAVPPALLAALLVATAWGVRRARA